MAVNDNLTSIKELASKLKITDALLKKLIKDFDIVTERVEKRIYLTESTVTTIREILALRASGKKNKEIKELFEASKVDQVPEAKASETNADEKAERADSEETDAKVSRKSKADPRKNKTNLKKQHKPKKSEDAATEPSAETVITNEEPNTNNETTVTEAIPSETVAAVAAEYEDSEEHALDISSYLDEDHKDDDLSIAMRLAEESGIVVEDSESTEDESINFEEDEEDEEIGAVEEVERTEDRLSPRKIRRRQFSFRYIQRQIANDSKRIQYIQQKLKRGRLSTKEEMNLKDSLEHRSKLLSGWVHLLRWVKS